MTTSHAFTRLFLALAALFLTASAALAADPGLAYPATSEASDQKAGSILFYNVYTSGATSGNAQNTRINITNTSSANSALVHLFFVADTCQVADSYICLTPNQTASFLASDVDPGVTGYIVAIAVDTAGIPALFNFLTGDEYVKFASGHAANLGAVAYSKLNNANVISTDGSLAAVFFDGVDLAGSYNRGARVVAVDNIPARADGNDTLVILNRVGGNLGTGAATLAAVFGLLYDDSESVFSFSVVGGCQLRSSLSNTFPRTTPRFETVIPAGRSGWLKIFSQSDIAISGAVINSNPNAAASSAAFNGGHNMHTLTLSAAGNYVIPVFPPSC
ncbi:MAG: hypothetical protein ACKVX9_11240 [Blastocatellia bacterium]